MGPSLAKTPNDDVPCGRCVESGPAGVREGIEHGRGPLVTTAMAFHRTGQAVEGEGVSAAGGNNWALVSATPPGPA